MKKLLYIALSVIGLGSILPKSAGISNQQLNKFENKAFHTLVIPKDGTIVDSYIQRTKPYTKNFCLIAHQKKLFNV